MSYNERDAMRDFTRDVAGEDLDHMADEEIAKLARRWRDRAVDIRTGRGLDTPMTNIIMPLVVLTIIVAIIWVLA
jgi:hypothetical protein